MVYHLFRSIPHPAGQLTLSTLAPDFFNNQTDLKVYHCEWEAVCRATADCSGGHQRHQSAVFFFQWLSAFVTTLHLHDWPSLLRTPSPRHFHTSPTEHRCRSNDLRNSLRGAGERRRDRKSWTFLYCVLCSGWHPLRIWKILKNITAFFLNLFPNFIRL